MGKKQNWLLEGIKEDDMSLVIKSLKWSLFSGRAKLSVKDEEGDLPIHLIAKNNRIEILEYILGKGADINATGVEGNTAYHWAAFRGHAQFIEKLEQFGANYILNEDGNYPLHLSALHGQLKATNEILNHRDSLINEANNDQDTALNLTSITGRKEVAEVLIKSGANIDHQNNNGDTVFNQVCINGFTDFAHLLVQNGASINIHNNDGDSPLLQSAMFGHIELVDFLLKHGAKINEVNSKGNGPLYWAAYRGRNEVCQRLIDSGADVNLKNAKGQSPLYWAVFKNYPKIVSLLISAGSIVDEDIKKVASRNKNEEIISLLNLN